MRSTFIGLAICSSLCAYSVANGQAAVSNTDIPTYADRVVNAFDAICLKNRGSWDGMKQAVGSSLLGFKPVGSAKGNYQADYFAFPTSIALKRWGQGYACIVESLIDEHTTENQLAERLAAEGFGLTGLQFKAEKKRGLITQIPGTGRSTGAGTFYTSVHVRLREGPIPGTQIAQLAVTN